MYEVGVQIIRKEPAVPNAILLGNNIINVDRLDFAQRINVNTKRLVRLHYSSGILELPDPDGEVWNALRGILMFGPENEEEPSESSSEEPPPSYSSLYHSFHPNDKEKQ